MTASQATSSPVEIEDQPSGCSSRLIVDPTMDLDHARLHQADQA